MLSSVLGFHAVLTSLHRSGFSSYCHAGDSRIQRRTGGWVGGESNTSDKSQLYNMWCRPYSPTCTILFNILWLHIILKINPLTQSTAWPVPSGLKAVLASAVTLVAQTLINTLHSSTSVKDVSVRSQTNHKKADEVELCQPAPERSFSRHPRRSVCSPGQVRC